MGNLQYRSTVWICRRLLNDLCSEDTCPPIPMFQWMINHNHATWRHYAVYIIWNFENEHVSLFYCANTLKYIDVLPALVKAYNHSYHRSIQEKPVNVNESNETEIWYRLYDTKKDNKVKKPQCQVGDKVRLNKKFRPFKKGYLPGWTEEVFLVKQIYTTKPVVTQFRR